MQRSRLQGAARRNPTDWAEPQDGAMNNNLAALRKFTLQISVFGAAFMALCDGLGIWLNPSYDPLRLGISKLALHFQRDGWRSSDSASWGFAYL